MPLSDIITVNISLATAGVAQAGFGVPLILSHTAAWVERVRFYSSLAGVLTDFATTTPEYKAAAKIFAQDIPPSKIAIGRAANKPTQRWHITVALVANTTAYKIRVGDNTATFTSDGSATNDEIVAGLLAAVNALSGDTLTATSTGSAGSLVLVLTGNAPADWNDVEVLDVNLLSIEQNHADPGVAADLGAIKNENNNWYGLITLYNSKAFILAVAAWVESNEKLYCALSQDTPIITTADSGATDVAKTLETSAYARTFPAYHPATGAFLDAAWMGECLPMDPGSETWKFKLLNSVAAVVLTTTHQTNLTDKHCNYFYEVATKNITTEGFTSSGEFVDVIRFRDWLKARMGERIFARLINAKKIAYTDAGIAIIESEVRAQLDEGIEVGGLANDPKPKVTVPKAASVSSADKNARTLNNVTFTATLAGAIHKLVITGVITS